MKHLSVGVLLLLWVTLSASATAEADDLATLRDWLLGSFSSEAQAAADSDFRHIVLHTVWIWPEAEDGCWLYVEQAAAEQPAAPYRQRVYQLGRGPEDTLISRVYELATPQPVAGAWRHPERLAALTRADLIQRSGCELILRREGAEFRGRTREGHCRSTHRGAVSATSEAVIRADGLQTWDRGWDADGRQVWGPEKGPYHFVKQHPQPGN